MNIIKPVTPEQIKMLETMREEILAVTKNRGDTVHDHHVLSMFAYTLGQMIAFQDQTRFTPAKIMELVASNIEKGNRDAIAGLADAAPAGRS